MVLDSEIKNAVGRISDKIATLKRNDSKGNRSGWLRKQKWQTSDVQFFSGLAENKRWGVRETTSKDDMQGFPHFYNTFFIKNPLGF